VTAHHLISEEKALIKCIYCGSSLKEDDWKSSFSFRRHYKENKCKCGKLHHVKIDIQSDGHDTWIKKRFKSIEDMLG